MSPSTGLEDLLDFAMDAAWQAGQSTLAHFQTGVSVEWKQDRSPVTVADREAEKLIRKLVEKRFPGHTVLGEEMGELGNPDGDSTHRWIIDPIDGTQSFVQGVPLYGVLLALEISGEMVLGVANFPALAEMVAAARGLGCRWNGRAARVSNVSRLEEALVCFSEPANLEKEGRERFWASLKESTRIRRGWGDCYGHCLVATGRAEMMLDPIMSLWDCAALQPILEEAGGTFTDWNGNPTARAGNAISTNGALFEPVMELMRAAF
jgi:histidinol phosphatase-like enzyme (inositol monophosphatase family)